MSLGNICESSKLRTDNFSSKYRYFPFFMFIFAFEMKTKETDMTLIVLAATMGNRYGGLKQLEGIGPNGETILDYSVYDAVKVGFTRIVFVISRYFEEEFKLKVAEKYEGLVRVDYVYQEVDLVPDHLRSPKRSLLWGSAHAVLMARDIIDAPFGVINAVNFYQRESFELLYRHLLELHPADKHYFMVSYRLYNVLPENAAVTRGICDITDDGKLLSVVDRHGVERISGNPVCVNEHGKTEPLDVNSFVSMNMWGFTPTIFGSLNAAFDVFITEHGMDLKQHFSIPDFINEMIRNGLHVQTFETPARWMGLVSPEDRSQVILRINELVRKGIYPVRLFEPN